MDELISFRTDKSFVNELKHIQKEERLDKSSVVRKLFELGLFEWKKEDAVRHILNGMMSISKAAKFLGVSYYQMLEILRERKVSFITIAKEELETELRAAEG